MAQYKVPQDVEADDKLLGPFTFRQFVYLMIMGGCIGLAVALAQIFILLAIIPLPFIIFFAALALPIKRDQPMETYLAAIISYHLKPNKRMWQPGQRESTIMITAPKTVEQPRARNLSEEEAGNRLSFLANVIDTEGYAVRGDLTNAPMHAEFLEEANDTPDIFETPTSQVIDQKLAEQQNARHTALVNQLRATINESEAANTNYNLSGATLSPLSSAQFANPAAMPATPTYPSATFNQSSNPSMPQFIPTPSVNPALQNLANNKEYSVATISKEAARVNNN